MALGDKINNNVQRMMTDDEYVFYYVDTVNNRQWFARGIEVRFYHLGGVLGVVRRLRERVQAQEQRIAALEARLAALEEQVGR